ncbi:hypothetical protein [Methylomonas methanica]|uniref:Uncharacterized protein n=1 Tax=Methylomonas methanica (strain DSM 25384 / MC09) TaxID=857087 RepID=G0A1L3_METMM|nr:hypothetical protein [Methylomonas methanica]AEG00074.1 hypothetical protein Metme_1655 [Methylomonas methanica MC09]
MKADDQEFIENMVIELDESIRRLVEEERRLKLKLGEDRVAELREFWHKQMPESEEESFKRSMDHADRKLTWIWLRLSRLHQSRAKAGRELMKRNSID